MALVKKHEEYYLLSSCYTQVPGGCTPYFDAKAGLGIANPIQLPALPSSGDVQSTSRYAARFLAEEECAELERYQVILSFRSQLKPIEMSIAMISRAQKNRNQAFLGSWSPLVWTTRNFGQEFWAWQVCGNCPLEQHLNIIASRLPGTRLSACSCEDSVLKAHSPAPGSGKPLTLSREIRNSPAKGA